MQRDELTRILKLEQDEEEEKLRKVTVKSSPNN